MNEHNTLKIREALRGFLRSYNLEHKLVETDLKENWSDWVGKRIAKHTNDISFKNGRLTVFLDSAVVKHQLSMKKQAMLDHLNKKLEGRPLREVQIR